MLQVARSLGAGMEELQGLTLMLGQPAAGLPGWLGRRNLKALSCRAMVMVCSNNMLEQQFAGSVQTVLITMTCVALLAAGALSCNVHPSMPELDSTP